jgi:hypothetical protein
LPARSFLVLGGRGQSTSRPPGAPRGKDIILGGAAADASACRKAVNPDGGAAACAPRGPARSARPGGRTRSRNALGCRWRQRGHSSRAGRKGTVAPRRDFPASAYPRGRPTPCRLARWAQPAEVAVGEEVGDVAGSGGIVADDAAGRWRYGGTSAGPANAATAAPGADRRHSSSGTVAVPGGRNAGSL